VATRSNRQIKRRTRSGEKLFTTTFVRNEPGTSVRSKIARRNSGKYLCSFRGIAPSNLPRWFTVSLEIPCPRPSAVHQSKILPSTHHSAPWFSTSRAQASEWGCICWRFTRLAAFVFPYGRHESHFAELDAPTSDFKHCRRHGRRPIPTQQHPELASMVVLRGAVTVPLNSASPDSNLRGRRGRPSRDPEKFQSRWRRRSRTRQSAQKSSADPARGTTDTACLPAALTL